MTTFDHNETPAPAGSLPSSGARPSRLPCLAEAKSMARALRAKLAAQGAPVGHAAALELVARRHGYRDWNTLRAAIADLPPRDWTPGGRLRGRYLGQPFAATVVEAAMVRPGWHRLALELDEAVDVVTFPSFSSFRKRVNCVLGPDGHSQARTSDGQPHVTVEVAWA